MSSRDQTRAIVGRARQANPPWILACLAGGAWLALWGWGVSPYAHYLRHHASLAGWDGWVAFAFFGVGWALMITAMMLPSATPLLAGFARLVAHRPERGRLQALVVVGFLGAWLGVGHLFQVAGSAAHGLLASIGWLESRPRLISGVVLGLAGLYQFTPLKSRCLTACRSPQGFIYRHWRGGRAASEAFRIGLAYGWSCVGCCWTLMLVMFALGLGSLFWMLGLGVLMAIEKNTTMGRRLQVPLGVALAVAAIGVALGGRLGVDGHSPHNH